MNFNKNEVTADILITTLQKAGVPEEKITAELVDTLKEEFILKGVINNSNVLNKSVEQTTKLLKELKFNDSTLNEHKEMIKSKFTELMIQKGTRKIDIKNGDNEAYDNHVRAFVSEEEFSKIYYGLCDKLTKRTIYKFDIDKDKFIEDCAWEINDYLRLLRAKNEYKIETGKAAWNI